MTLNTWLNEFYPDYLSGSNIADPVAAHARLFDGLHSDNMAKHAVHKRDNEIIDDADPLGVFYLCLLTEPLCSEYFDMEDYSCAGCPIDTCAEEYRAWRENNDPEPMLAKLAAIENDAADIDEIEAAWLPVDQLELPM